MVSRRAFPILLIWQSGQILYQSLRGLQASMEGKPAPFSGIFLFQGSFQALGLVSGQVQPSSVEVVQALGWDASKENSRWE